MVEKVRKTTEPIVVDERLCLVCGGCVGACPVNAMFLTATKLTIDSELCIRCDRCVDLCPAGALSNPQKAGIK